MIKIKDIYKTYGEKDNKVEVLKGIDLKKVILMSENKDKVFSNTVSIGWLQFN